MVGFRPSTSTRNTTPFDLGPASSAAAPELALDAGDRDGKLLVGFEPFEASAFRSTSTDGAGAWGSTAASTPPRTRRAAGTPAST